MSLVKWVFSQTELLDAEQRRKGCNYSYVPVIPLADLRKVVEGLRENIAHSFINTDEISAYRLACEHILTQFEAHRKEGA